MRRLPSGTHGAVFGLTMALLYSGLMSGVFTGMARGWTFDTLTAWPHVWALAFLIAAQAGLVLRPLAQAVADALVGVPDRKDNRS